MQGQVQGRSRHHGRSEERDRNEQYARATGRTQGRPRPEAEAEASAAARTLRHLTEPLHAVSYFDATCRGLGKAIGLKGFWMGYLAARTAPLGAVSAPPATELLGVFAPAMIARALPAAWDVVGPERVLDARARCAADALRAADPAVEASVTKVASALRAMVDDAPRAARPLFAANQALCDRADPVEDLWQLATALREFRGDAHLSVLAEHELDGCESLVLAVACGLVPEESMRQDRGWTEEEWTAATARLRSRGLVDSQGAATTRGAAERTEIEQRTDDLAARLLRPLSTAQTDQLLRDLKPVTHRVLATKLLPFPNPIGLPPPPASSRHIDGRNVGRGALD
ncbi:SCO6745 family protein [Streptomyces benahoarensis]|uniref:SCO6745 family protein n=1 Tax=Streptomyces benahoarensis TaxID=2595054 RepID=UPI002034E049|nr:hypothetical protein [Streptomyces benahoarensis]